jgi:hypothetical protein
VVSLFIAFSTKYVIRVLAYLVLCSDEKSVSNGVISCRRWLAILSSDIGTFNIYRAEVLTTRLSKEKEKTERLAQIPTSFGKSVTLRTVS